MNLQRDPRVYIFTGHFGSGKTEVAVNFAAELRRQKPSGRVALIDLDIINPFFRSADVRDRLEQKGITVEAPLYANTNVDAPALTGKMGALIGDPACDVILDVGGDDLGAHAVGYYGEQIRSRPYTLFFVLNPFRPFTSTLSSALKIYDEVESACGLRIDGIVNNSNLLERTTPADVTGALPLLREIAAARGVPVLMHAARRELVPALEKALGADALLGMDTYIKLLFDRV